MTRSLFLAAALAATAVASAGFAAQTTTPRLTKADTNADGNISRAEFIAQANTRFTRLDTDKNGVLSGTELRFGHGPRHLAGPQDGPPPPGAGAMRGRMADMLAQLDTDRDGKISRAEFTTRSNDRFAKLDTNGDGRITDDELKPRPPRDARPGPGDRRAGMVGRMIERLDSNDDGVITRAEFDAGETERFTRLDANGDGVIDTAEREAMRGPGGPGGPGRPGADVPPPPPPPSN